MNTLLSKVGCLACCLLFISPNLEAQQIFSLQACLEYAVEHNHNLKKARYDNQKAAYARKEVLGTLLPQVNVQQT